MFHLPDRLPSYSFYAWPTSASGPFGPARALIGIALHPVLPDDPHTRPEFGPVHPTRVLDDKMTKVGGYEVDSLQNTSYMEIGFAPCIGANSLRRVFAWINIKVKTNEKACVYVPASMSDVLAKKHESLTTTKEVMGSLSEMFGQPEWSLRHKAIKYIYSRRMKEGTSVREHVLDMMMHFNVVEINGGAIDEANQENNSWKRLSEGEITLKVGMGEMVSAEAVGELKIFLGNKYIIQNNVLIRRLVKSGLLSELEDKSLPPCESCLEGKMTKRSFTGKGLRAKIPLELIHSNLYRPMNVKAQGGQTHPSQEFREPRRSGRVVHQPDRYMSLSETQVVIPDGVEDLLTYKQMDVKTAFLIGNLEESIYMVQPEGFIEKGQEQKNVDEPYVYKKVVNSIVAFLVLYVDGILLIGNDVDYLTKIKKWLATQFQMKDLGDEQFVLGIQIVRNCRNRTLAMSQAYYIDKMLSRYKMQNSKKGLLPYKYGIHLSKEQCPKTSQEIEDMRNILYASAVGSLMYAMLCTRPDICYSVGMVNRKSTSRSVFTLNGGAIVWRSVKNTCIADSTMEAEYVAACEAAKEAVWLRTFLTDLEIVPNMHLPITLYYDNSGVVANSREPRSHKWEKHIEPKYRLIREIVNRGDVIVTQISSKQNIVDPFTKAPMAKVFEGHL
ncbi:gag/pol protein [Cucumis melo var. makuwa]|uniref:Gag/pol protein n=1 Tax=Cucumis melo var. makuwa TaxID=1194695 RepID=A0A5A7U5C8_CUCMM|nr:gag/pol protein [Cucumis melo var. makuwa]TYK31542.1 gag/pol protein [Cucumis melo var. makuwa]